MGLQHLTQTVRQRCSEERMTVKEPHVVQKAQPVPIILFMAFLQ